MANTQAQSGPERGLAEPGLLRLLAENWWLLLSRALPPSSLASCILWPGLTLITLTWLWGAYALSDGVIAIWAAFNASGAMPVRAGGWASVASSHPRRRRGVLVYRHDDARAADVHRRLGDHRRGRPDLGAIALRKALQHEWLLIINGVLSIAFGAILMVQPGAGALAVAWMIAWYAIFFGCLYVALAFRLRQYKKA